MNMQHHYSIIMKFVIKFQDSLPTFFLLPYLYKTCFHVNYKNITFAKMHTYCYTCVDFYVTKVLFLHNIHGVIQYKF